MRRKFYYWNKLIGNFTIQKEDDKYILYSGKYNHIIGEYEKEHQAQIVMNELVNKEIETVNREVNR